MSLKLSTNEDNEDNKRKKEQKENEEASSIKMEDLFTDVRYMMEISHS